MPLPLFREIRIENTNACGYRCVMCPRESQTRRIGFMPLDDFSLVLERVAPFQGLAYLHGFGESLLDRQLIEKVQLFKEKLPFSVSGIFSTLGVRVADDYFIRLLDAGLNGLIISLYGFTQEDYKKIHGVDALLLVKRNLQLLSNAMKDCKSFNAVIKLPAARLSSSLPVAEPPEKFAFCEWVRELGFTMHPGTHLHNYSNGRNYNTPNTERCCPVVTGKRKNILNITWDLKVIPCCYDYNATIPFGDLRRQSLEEIFSSPEYLRFVLAHRTGEIDAYPVCKNCEKDDFE